MTDSVMAALNIIKSVFLCLFLFIWDKRKTLNWVQQIKTKISLNNARLMLPSLPSLICPQPVAKDMFIGSLKSSEWHSCVG